MSDLAHPNRLRAWMMFSTFAYASAGLFFALVPEAVLLLTGWITGHLGLPDTPPAAERFWLTLAVSMMVMLTVCSALVAKDVFRNHVLCIPVMVSKFTSSFLGVAYFALHARHGALLIIGLIDLPLGLITYVLWRNLRRALRG